MSPVGWRRTIHRDAHLENYSALLTARDDGWRHSPALPFAYSISIIRVRILADIPLFPLYTLGRIQEIDDPQANEDHPPKRVLPGRTPHVPDDGISESGRLGAGYCTLYEEDWYRLRVT
jgi:hypothetical protein